MYTCHFDSALSKWNKFMCADIIIYMNAVRHIFAKPVAKCLTLVKVMSGQTDINYTYGVAVKREVSFQ